MAAHARRADPRNALSDRAQRLAGERAPQAGRGGLLRHAGRPVRRDARAVRTPPARDECLSPYVRFRPAVPASAAARCTAPLQGALGRACMVYMAARYRKIL